MHAYATDANDRETIPLWLAASAVALTLSLNSSLKALSLDVPWWIDAPSVMGFYGLLYQWFDKNLWYRKISFLSFSSIPNLNGTWAGIIHSNYDGGTDVPEVILYIRQTWLGINIRLETKNSSSFSIMAAVNSQESSEPSLKYEYMNEPSALSIRTMEAHRGTANLKLSSDGVSLDGDYFTGRGRQSLGTMKFKLVSRDYLTREKAFGQP